ncbi:hypothetical protein [Mycobacterium sp. SMC-4]|uniref:hypothetical protein n=1 Tax=Mycobacterium sp. SMC-4 TaxID=2857059 RepID=UPI0021B2D235|nr:hypothetical protein [Mycobacterium sp. SMC-4]UXA16309.1 hypothetical protein KXD98_15870 [Mycobacterium sp. SMC-4]
MARRNLTRATATADATAFETEGFQAGANTLVLLFVTSARPALGGGTPSVPTVTGNGLRWTLEQSVVYGNDRRLSCFRASGPAPVGGGAIIDFGAQTQDFCAWSVFEYTDVDVTVANGGSALAQSFSVTSTGRSLSVPLSRSADADRNVVTGALAVDSSSGAAVTVSAGAGFDEIDNVAVAQFLGKAGALHTQDAPASADVISWTWSSPQSAAAIVLEVKAVPANTGPGTGTGSGPGGSADDGRGLIERFEPILFFHESEKYFPSDAKRFVERAALWAARLPGDDKAGWGGAPTVAATGLAAVDGEPGEFRFGEELGGNDHRFLELGGWKDSNGSHEDGVSAQTTNRYSDRGPVDTLYAAELEPSRFWYHAEVIHKERLGNIASRQTGVNLTALIDGLDAPTLLCYYFFFPAHEQGVVSSRCNNIEAREVSSHVGDWQCLAILGEGAGAAFTPKFMGRTGTRPNRLNGQFPAYQFDSDQNTVMVVDAWTPADPQVVDGHPRLYVAAGSHSLYTRPGSKTVNAYPDDRQPQYCGTLDVPSPAGDGDSWELTATKDVAVLLAKMIAAGPFGFLGAAAALVSCVVEIAHYRAPMAPFGAAPDDVGSPDQPPAAAGAGKTIKPASVSVPDAGADVVDWRCRPRQPLVESGRTYDCVVDRDAQGFWPHPDTKRGFRGRWGQHVTADGLARRAGPRFPDYPSMFLMALADGVGRTPPLFTLDG